MAVTGVRRGRHRSECVRVGLISDDSFSPTQTTRVLNLTVLLPIRADGCEQLSRMASWDLWRARCTGPDRMARPTGP
jgi:hypothetical protein